MKPNERGVPLCDEEECSEFDGKRCGLLGCQPGRACEPAVTAVVKAAREVVEARREASTGIGNTIPMVLAQAIDHLARHLGMPDGPGQLPVGRDPWWRHG
jgi:hypothetical protein